MENSPDYKTVLELIEKIGKEEVLKELGSKGISSDLSQKMFDLLLVEGSNNEKSLNSIF